MPRADAVDTTSYLITSFVCRGDASASDFTEATLTVDGAWHELDLSSIVPVGAVAVLLTVSAADATPGNGIYLENNDYSNHYNVSRVVVQNDSVSNVIDCIVSCSSDRKLKYYIYAGTDSISIIVKGWWL